MRSNYKKIGPYIRQVDVRNVEDKKKNLLGVSTQKVFIDSIANTVGTDFRTYKVVKRRQFTYVADTSRRGDRIGIALLDTHDEGLVSPIYTVFEIIDKDILLPEYLMMWFRRPEFDRYARFKSHGSVRELFDWDEMCDVELPMPSIKEQREIVREYHTIYDRIMLNERLNQKLEETAQAIYKQWFVDFDFPISSEYAVTIGKPELEGELYKSCGGEMVYNEVLKQEIPVGWGDLTLSEIVSMKYGKMLDAQLMGEQGYPVFSGYGIRGYYKEYMYEDPQILVVARGVSGTGEVRMSPAKSYITNLSIVLEMNDGEVKKEYLYHYLKNSNLRSLDSGSAQAQITIADLEKVKVMQPTVDLQIRFSRFSSAITTSSLHIKEMNSHLKSFSDLLFCKMSRI